MVRLSKKGFSMIELLVVLLIIGILAAVAAPLFLGNTDRAKASEAVAVLGQIRSAEREYFAKHGSYLAVSSGNLANDPEAASNPGLGITIGATQYFSNACYTVITASPAFTGTVGGSTTAADFIARANGASSAAFASGVGARHPGDVNGSPASDGTTTTKTIVVEMDNSGKTNLGITPAGGSIAWSGY